MIGIYFSGTGNSKYCVECFLQAYDLNAKAYAIEDKQVIDLIKQEEEIIFAYPVQYSNLPKFVSDFMKNNADLWKSKKVFVVATMGLFSGDGAGVLARQLKQYGATILGGVHVRMPDSICDEKPLKKLLLKNRKIVADAKATMIQTAEALKNGHPPKVGLGFFSHMIGLFGQRLYFYNKTKEYTDRLKVHNNQCIGCGSCVALCPTQNLMLVDGKAVSSHLCTMCYRCVNTCPHQAITLLGKSVIEQGTIDKYLVNK